jgi:hypothetical protein
LRHENDSEHFDCLQQRRSGIRSGLGVSDADTSAHHAFRIGFSLLLGALAFWPENRELLKPIIA